MHALFFEVRPKPGHLEHYFAHVDVLKPMLARHRGLIFLDRYKALHDEAVLLSHQRWEDEAAIQAWRNDPVHRRSQEAGRKIHFEDYRIRIGERVLHLEAGCLAEDDHLPNAAGFLVSAYGTEAPRLDLFRTFESVNHQGSFIALAQVATAGEAFAAAKAVASVPGVAEASAYRLVRDYGMHERAEAPQ